MMCDTCENFRCTVCDHEACPVCQDCCDHPACMLRTPDQRGRVMLTKDHACVFPACPNGCRRGYAEHVAAGG